MQYSTLKIKEAPKALEVTINQVSQHNALNSQLLNELHQVLDEIEYNSAYKTIILAGQPGVFCTGMDFQEMTHSPNTQGQALQFASQYMELLKLFSLSSKIILTKVEGQVTAGGVGLVAASDLVFATPNSQFSLSEALWGLLPANVLPYLIRRIGFQKAYIMALTTHVFSAAEALSCYLVDEISDNLDESIRRYLLRMMRIDQKTIKELKAYVRKLWMINESIEQIAIQELARLLQEPRVRTNIKNFVEQQKFPWEATHE